MGSPTKVVQEGLLPYKAIREYGYKLVERNLLLLAANRVMAPHKAQFYLYFKPQPLALLTTLNSVNRLLDSTDHGSPASQHLFGQLTLVNIC